jgi:hypothetical protein
MWHYKADETSSDTPRAIAFAPNYFSDAKDLITAGDLIIISSARGGLIGMFVGEGKVLTILPIAPPS